MPTHRCRSWVTRAGLVKAAVLLVLASGGSLLFAQGPGDTLLSIQRVLIKPEQAAKELQKAGPGGLLLMPLAEFDERLERAHKAQKARVQKPHLTRAHYSAEMIDRSLSGGSGQWAILNPGPVALLPLHSLNLALGRVKWEQAGEAILGELDGKSPGLLVPHTGLQTCLFDWSARGDLTADGVAFSLSVPPCAISTFELKLPADCVLAAVKDTEIVTGPHETESPAKRLWKLQSVASGPIDFTVRKLAEAKSPAGAIFARAHSVQKLTAQRVDVEHEFHIDVLHGSVRTLILDGDATLEPYAVSLPASAVKDWQWRAGSAPKDGKTKAVRGQLSIELHQPLQGTLANLRVRSLAKPAGAGGWTSPELRVRDALFRGETLELRLSPSLPVGAWDAGSFRPMTIVTENDGTQVITLAQTVADAASQRRPRLAAPLHDVDLQASEQHVWHIAPRHATLAAHLHYATALGNLFQLRVKLPPAALGYHIDTLDLHPPETLAGWHLDAGVLLVDLKQPLSPGKQATLKIQMRAGLNETTTGERSLVYPELQPIDAAKRAGTLAVVVDPALRHWLVRSSLPLAASDSDRHALAPPGDPAHEYWFTFRDQALNLALAVAPQATPLQLFGRHTIALADRNVEGRFSWEVQPLNGAPQFLDFRLAPGFPTGWQATSPAGSVRIHRWERLREQEALPHLLHLVGAPGAQAAALETMLPRGTYWRFHFAEPLRKKTSFTLQTAAVGDRKELPSHDRAWSIPLMTPVQHGQIEQEMVVESPGEPIVQVVADSSLLSQTAALPPDRGASRVQLRQSGRLGAPASTIAVRTRPESRGTSQLERCDEAGLATYVHKDGRAYYRVQFRVWHWPHRTCELQLPAGATVLSVKANDSWLGSPDLLSRPDAVRLSLPIDQNAPFVRYEILMRLPPMTGQFPGVGSVNFPNIGWPAMPLEVRTRFFLERGLIPWSLESLVPVGVPARLADQTQTPRLLRQIWNAGHAWLPYGAAARLLQQLEEQKGIVLQSERKLHEREPKALKMSEALERLATASRDPLPLIIDLPAFRELGINPDTPIGAAALSQQAGRPFWESLGLVYVACPSGAVLSSPGRVQRLNLDEPLQAAELEDAVQEAILHGRDTSASLFLFTAWTTHLPEDVDSFLGSADGTNGVLAEMTEWEFRPGVRTGHPFAVVDPTIARGAGWLLAVLTALALWGVQRRLERRTCFRVHVALLGASILGVVWSPLNMREFFLLPMLVVQIAALLWCVVRIVLAHGEDVAGANSSLGRFPASPALVGLMLLGIGWNAAAQPAPPRSYTVFVVDGQKPAVLVSPDLLAKLSEVDSPTATGTPGAVLVGARYSGKIMDLQARFDVVYDVHSFKDKASLVIPLTGVQLTEAFLDGAPVFPAPHKNGFAVPIRTKGSHTLRLAFSTRASADADQIDLRFTIPRLMQNEFRIDGLLPARNVHCPQCLGEERWSNDAGPTAKTWHANLGPVNSLSLRWTAVGVEPGPKTMEVREFHFWDLQSAVGGSLWTSLTYSAGKSGLAQFLVALPEGLHVRTVEASGPAGVVVRRWETLGKGDQRRVVVTLAQPVSGIITLNLDIVPLATREPGKLLLTLPAPLQGKSIAGLLGYRLDAPEIEPRAQNLAPQSITPEEFERQWKKQGVPISRAYSFQRKAVKAWMELIVRPTARLASGQLQWRVDADHADLQAKITIRSVQEDLIVLEFHVDPGLTLADVSGEDVQRWHLKNALLQVWLRQPRSQTTLTLKGWSRPKLSAKRVFSLPSVYCANVQSAGVALEVKAARGLVVSVEKTRNLQRTEPSRLQFSIDKTPYEATFRLDKETPPPQADVLTKVHPSAQGIEFLHVIRLATERGELPNLALHLKGGQIDMPHLDAPGAKAVQLDPKTADASSWRLTYPNRLPSVVVVTIRGRMTKAPTAPVPLPTVTLDGADVHAHWLAWKDLEISDTATGHPLTPRKSLDGAAPQQHSDPWATEDGAWGYAPWRSGLTAASPKTATSSAVRVLSTSERTRHAGASRWIHEASYWVHAPTATEMRFRFPAPIDMFSVWKNRRLQPAIGSAAPDFVLPLGGSPVPCLIELRWQYTSSETPAAPNLGAIVIDQVPLPVRERIVWLPPGMTTASDQSATLVARLCHEAHAHFEFTAALAQEPVRSDAIAMQIAQSRRTFYRVLRQAEYTLRIARHADPDFSQSEWARRLSDLKRRDAELPVAGNIALPQPAPQTPVPADASTTLRGIPVIVPSDVPFVPLHDDAKRAFSEQQTRCALTLLGAIFLIVFSFLRHGWAVLRRFYPEASLAALAAVMAFWGLSAIGLALIGVLLAWRAIWIAVTVKAWLASFRSDTRFPAHDGPPPTA